MNYYQLHWTLFTFSLSLFIILGVSHAYIKANNVGDKGHPKLALVSFISTIVFGVLTFGSV